MRILTIATKAEGYFDLLKQTSAHWGYDLQALGWQEAWKGFSWKLSLYIDALKDIPSEEPVICVDGYDVVVLAPASEMEEKFKKFNQPIIFSGQRYFPNQKWMQILADQVMSNDLSKTIRKKSKDSKDYSRPCMGLLIAYAGELLNLFQELMEIEKVKSIVDDQTLLNIYYLRHPDSIYIDTQCDLFQNIWRTRGGLYGKISSKDRNSEIEVYHDESINAKRVRNKIYHTTACLIHAPFNLDMGLLLEELHISNSTDQIKKNRDYWQYSIVHHIKRAFKLYCKRILFTVLIIALIGFLYYFLTHA